MAQMAPNMGGSTRLLAKRQGAVSRQVHGGPSSMERVRAGVLPVFTSARARISGQVNHRARYRVRPRLHGQRQPRNSQYAELRKKATQKPAQPPQEKPVTRITASKAKGTVDPDKMSPDQWLKWRNAQIKKSR